jgi:hypothetical protein
MRTIRSTKLWKRRESVIIAGRHTVVQHRPFSPEDDRSNPSTSKHSSQIDGKVFAQLVNRNADFGLGSLGGWELEVSKNIHRCDVCVHVFLTTSHRSSVEGWRPRFRLSAFSFLPIVTGVHPKIWYLLCPGRFTLDVDGFAVVEIDCSRWHTGRRENL